MYHAKIVMREVNPFLNKIILSSLFCAFLFVNALNTQDYKPFIEPNKYWDVSTIMSGTICNPPYTSLDRYFFVGDTSINDINYSKVAYHSMIYDPDAPPFCVLLGFSRDTMYRKDFFLREDIDAQQVFRYDTNEYDGDKEAEEVLIYDFSLEVGDALPAACGGSEDSLIIASIDVKLDEYGMERRIFKVEFEHIDDCVEGLGLGGVFYPACNSIEGGSGYCHYYDSIQRPNPCFDFITSAEEKVEKNEIAFFPNPVYDVLSFENLPKNSFVEIFTAQGKLIFERNLISEGSINVAELPTGILFARITNSERRLIYQVKLVKAE